MSCDIPENPVAFRDGTISREKLPCPIVHYPGFYGAYFAFQKSEHGKLYICSCTYESIKNYLRFRTIDMEKYAGIRRPYIIGNHDFPIALINQLKKKHLGDLNGILEALPYKDKICHECNIAIPEYRYCVEMYGGVFKQTFGWYIAKQAFEFGVKPAFKAILYDACPLEISELLSMRTDEFEKLESSLLNDFRKLDALRKKNNKEWRKVRGVIENAVRTKFQHKNIGDAWTSETILYQMVLRLFPNHKIIRHARPDFLHGLELDIFMPDKNVAIEYQGIQHFEPVEHWGGEAALEATQRRDERKRNICQQLGIKLLYFKYDTPLSEKYVCKYISMAISDRRAR